MSLFWGFTKRIKWHISCSLDWGIQNWSRTWNRTSLWRRPTDVTMSNCLEIKLYIPEWNTYVKLSSVSLMMAVDFGTQNLRFQKWDLQSNLMNLSQSLTTMCYTWEFTELSNLVPFWTWHCQSCLMDESKQSCLRNHWHSTFTSYHTLCTLQES